MVCSRRVSAAAAAVSACTRASARPTRHAARRRAPSRTAATAATSVRASRATCATDATSAMKTEDCTATSCSTTDTAASAGVRPPLTIASPSLSLYRSLSLSVSCFSVNTARSHRPSRTELQCLPYRGLLVTEKD